MLNVFRNLDYSVLLNILLAIVPALICITFHELAHGFVAYKLGDPTAKSMGRLTLNPIKHIDPIGLAMMAIARFGWAKPVPVDMRNFKNPRRGMAITALAGPVSNLILAFIALLVTLVAFEFWRGETAMFIYNEMLIRMAGLSVSLAVFNILPIPPLDGSKILFSFLPNDIYMKLMKYERFGFILLILLINTSIFSNTIGVAVQGIFTGMANIIGRAVTAVFG